MSYALDWEASAMGWIFISYCPPWLLSLPLLCARCHLHHTCCAHHIPETSRAYIVCQACGRVFETELSTCCESRAFDMAFQTTNIYFTRLTLGEDEYGKKRVGMDSDKIRNERATNMVALVHDQDF